MRRKISSLWCNRIKNRRFLSWEQPQTCWSMTAETYWNPWRRILIIIDRIGLTHQLASKFLEEEKKPSARAYCEKLSAALSWCTPDSRITKKQKKKKMMEGRWTVFGLSNKVFLVPFSLSIHFFLPFEHKWFYRVLLDLWSGLAIYIPIETKDYLCCQLELCTELTKWGVLAFKVQKRTW